MVGRRQLTVRGRFLTFRRSTRTALRLGSWKCRSYAGGLHLIIHGGHQIALRTRLLDEGRDLRTYLFGGINLVAFIAACPGQVVPGHRQFH